MFIALLAPWTLFLFYITGTFERLDVSLWRGLSIWLKSLEFSVVITIGIITMFSGAHWGIIQLVLIVVAFDAVYTRKSITCDIDGEKDYLPWPLNVIKCSIVLASLIPIIY